MPDSVVRKKKATVGNLIFSLVFLLVFPALTMLLAGNWFWVEGLVFSGWFVIMCFYLTVWLFINNPSLFLERVKPSTANQKTWDKVFIVLLFLFFVGWFSLMPLDASRFHWSPAFPVWLEVIGGLMLVPSAFFFIRSYMDNHYLSGVVRIQDDRGQKVVSTGVYGFVRHPMYLGGLLMFIGVPLLVGSMYGLILSLVFVAGFVYRIFGEERMLDKELEGYIEYKKKIRYRLLPFIW